MGRSQGAIREAYETFPSGSNVQTAVGVKSGPIHCRHPRLGWVEHVPLEIWNAQMLGARTPLEMTRVAPCAIRAVAVTNQRQTSIVCDRETGQDNAVKHLGPLPSDDDRPGPEFTRKTGDK